MTPTSPSTSGETQEPRDVLADRIEQWADTDDWHVYDYADRLLNDLDAAGFEIRRKPHDPERDTEAQGATLMFGLLVPEANENDDADDVADGIIGALNETRRRLGGRRLTVSLWPTPQWFTADTMKVLRQAHELVINAAETGGGTER